MGSAIIEGILRKQCLPADALYVSRKHPEKSAALAQRGAHILPDNVSLVQAVDAVVLAVKPVYVPEVLAEVREALSGNYCRCGTHYTAVESIMAYIEQMKEERKQ